MKIRRIFFVCGIMMIAFLCMMKMNISYNRLSRYQYTQYMSEEEQQLVTDRLTDKEIEYLIEWSISPKEYINFIQEENFSIYHLTEYNYLAYNHSYLSASQIVSLYETCRENYTIEEISELLLSYNTETILFWMKHGDQYNPDARLVWSAKNNDTFLSDDWTISNRVPADLVELKDVPVLDDEGAISVNERMVAPLQQLCAAIVEQKVSTRACGGLVVKQGYVSYQKQITLFEEANRVYGEEALFYTDYPGHSEHQLGLAIDFAVSGLKSDNFNQTRQYEWLQENAWRYGFIETYIDEVEAKLGKHAQPEHWRFVGVEEARIMYEEGLTILDCLPD